MNKTFNHTFKIPAIAVLILTSNCFPQIDFLPRYIKSELISHDDLPTFGWLKNGPDSIDLYTSTDSLVRVYLDPAYATSDPRLNSNCPVSNYYGLSIKNDTLRISSFNFYYYSQDSILIKSNFIGSDIEFKAKLHASCYDGIYAYPTRRRQAPFLIVYGVAMILPFVLLGLWIF